MSLNESIQIGFPKSGLFNLITTC